MNITVNGEKVKLPDFIIVGASRSGTSSLFYYLSEHREIFMPKEKEPEFFNFPQNRGVKEYAELFYSASDSQRIGESTTTYLYYYKECINNIKLIYGADYRRLKIIAILRNPIDRAWSYFMLLKRMGKEIDFFDTVKEYEKIKDNHLYHDFINSGKYHKQVEAFSETFPYTKFWLFDDFMQRTTKVLKEVYEFLELDDCAFIPDNVKVIYNASGLAKNRAYIPIHNFLFRENKMKVKLKNIVPIKIRQKIKTNIANRILKKDEMPEDVKIYLSRQFESNLKSLIKLFTDPKDIETIENWTKIQ
jgi:hypothetical protein